MDSDILNLGVHAYISDDFKQAADLFTKVIDSEKDNQNALLYRASSYIKLGQFESAIYDLTNLEKKGNASFELYYKLGYAYFNALNFKEANDSLKQALSKASSNEQRQSLSILSNKLEIELKENNITLDNSNYSKQTLKDNENNTNESNVSQKVEDKESVNNNNNNIVKEEKVFLEEKTTPKIKFIHNWIQTATHIIVTLQSLTTLNKDKYLIAVEQKAIRITAVESGEVIFELNLTNNILPDSSTYEIKNTRVEFNLKKEIDNFNWINLINENFEGKADIKTLYPSSSKTKKNWDELNKELAKEEEKLEGNEGMMKIFKEMYERGDENTRRAMAKSYSTSGGTVLSMDWNDVKDKDYEGKDRPDAPDGQKWAKGDKGDKNKKR